MSAPIRGSRRCNDKRNKVGTDDGTSHRYRVNSFQDSRILNLFTDATKERRERQVGTKTMSQESDESDKTR